MPGLMPPSIDALIQQQERHRHASGASGAVVELIGDPDHPRYILKHGQGALIRDIADEVQRLSWVAERLPVPALAAFAEQDGEAWMLTGALPGESAYRMMLREGADTLAIASEIGGFLRRIHSLPIDECPFDMRVPGRLVQARANIDHGLVDSDDFDPERAGWTPEEIWEDMISDLPPQWEEVVTHGDYSLDNILLDGEGRVTGIVDLGRLGVADPYQDLAILWNSLGDFGKTAQDAAFAAYGLAEVDIRRLNFHLMLDEFS